MSVLLDAGAGDHWRYTESGTKNVYERSEGIAVASLHMFTSLLFTKSGTGSIPQVEGMICNLWAQRLWLMKCSRQSARNPDR